MMTATASTVLSVRVTEQERALLATAAEQIRTTISDFVRRTALESAEVELLTRTFVSIPAEQWTAFESWIDRPPELIPALTELALRRPTWER